MGNPFPPPGAPSAPPYQIAMQPDGSGKYYVPSPDGNPLNDVVIGVIPPPKLPKAFQKPPTQQPPQ